MPRNRRDRWKARVIKAGNLPNGTKLFLSSVLVEHMRANGHVSCPRRTLAADLGTDERTVTRHITRAKEAGWLIVVHPGYRGSTAEYQATFPNTESGTTAVPHFEAQKAGQVLPPNHGTELSPFLARKRDNWCPAKEVPIGTYGTAVEIGTVRIGPGRDDDGFDEYESVTSARRVAPTLADLIRDELSSSSVATRHLRVVS